MKTAIFVGAGAEISLGFSAGQEYTVNTFYTKKPALYAALKEFYESKLKKETLPAAYSSQFLFDKNGRLFTALLDNLFNYSPAELENITGVSFDGRNVNDIESQKKEAIFERFIVETEFGQRDQAVMQYLTATVPDAHYGILETYFSSLLNPRAHSGHFWKLINFYWSAFFEILKPLMREKEIEDARLYSHVLHHLLETLEFVHSEDEVKKNIKHPDSYYYEFPQAFDYVLTTNYTPFAKVLSKEESNAIYLAGSLREFENASSLDVFDAIENSRMLEEDVVFPFMMAQSPVKPIISQKQLQQYSSAITALEDIDVLCVLGYSFTDNDAHIASLIRGFLKSRSNKRLIYFKLGEGSSRNVAQRLRFDCDSDEAQRIDVASIGKEDQAKSVRMELVKRGII